MTDPPWRSISEGRGLPHTRIYRPLILVGVALVVALLGVAVVVAMVMDDDDWTVVANGDSVPLSFDDTCIPDPPEEGYFATIGGGFQAFVRVESRGAADALTACYSALGLKTDVRRPVKADRQLWAGEVPQCKDAPEHPCDHAL